MIAGSAIRTENCRRRALGTSVTTPSPWCTLLPAPLVAEPFPWVTWQPSDSCLGWFGFCSAFFFPPPHLSPFPPDID